PAHGWRHEALGPEQTHRVAARLEALRVRVGAEQVPHARHVVQAAVRRADALDGHEPPGAQHGAVRAPVDLARRDHEATRALVAGAQPRAQLLLGHRGLLTQHAAADAHAGARHRERALAERALGQLAEHLALVALLERID